MISICLNVIDTMQDQERFIKIYNTHKNLMHFVARRILNDDQLAEDAVQEAFIGVAKNFDRIKGLDEDHLKNLLAILARNEAVNILRKESKHIKDDSFDEDEVLNSIASGDDTFSEANCIFLKDAILKLPDTYRSILYLIAVCELDLKDAAGLLHISYETAKKRLQRSRKLMEKYRG